MVVATASSAAVAWPVAVGAAAPIGTAAMGAAAIGAAAMGAAIIGCCCSS